MRYIKTRTKNLGAKLISPGRTDIYSVPYHNKAKVRAYPFVDKTRTMTGRVSENI